MRLLVHPESIGLYKDLVASGAATPGGDFHATATASSRTLIAWPADKPRQALFAKLSLDKEIGGVRRTISRGEVARSVGINDVLALAAKRRALPRSFKYIPETFSTIPKGMAEGGFDIDFDFRRQQKLALPKKLATITTVEKDYKVDKDPARALKKLDSFFWGGLAYNLDKDLPLWSRDGLLRGKGAARQG